MIFLSDATKLQILVRGHIQMTIFLAAEKCVWCPVARDLSAIYSC